MSNVRAIQEGRGGLGAALRAEEMSRTQLREDNNETLFPQSLTSRDYQLYRLLTQVGLGDGSGSDSLMTDDVLRYAHTASLYESVALGHGMLLVASGLRNPAYVSWIQEGYDTAADRVERDVAYLRDNPGHGLGEDVLEAADNVRNAGGKDGQMGFFERLESRLKLVAKESDLIEENADILDDLMDQLSHLSAEVRGEDAPAVPMPAPVDTMDPGVSDSEILFGQSAAFTGSNDSLGQGMRLGIEAAFKEANDAGGVAGRMLELDTKDDLYEPDEAFANTLRFVEGDNPVFALIGSVGTPTSRAALPLTLPEDNDAGVPFVGAFTGAQLLREDDLTNVLNFRASYHDETREMVKHLYDAGMRKVAVLYQNDSYGVDGLTGVRTALMEHDLEPVASWYYARNTSAVQSAAFRIAEAEPDAVIIIGTSKPAAAIIQKLRMKLGPDTIFMNVSFVGSNALKDELDELDENHSNIYVTQVVPLPSDESNTLVSKYRAALADGWTTRRNPASSHWRAT